MKPTFWQARTCEKITEDFQETFVLDYAADSQPPDDLLPLAVSWDLDQENGGIIINLASFIIKAEPKRSDPLASVWVLANVNLFFDVSSYWDATGKGA